MKPVESNVSPYLQQPLRTLDEVRQERERRQRELANAAATKPPQTVPPMPRPSAAPTNAPGTPGSPRVDQTI